MPPGGAALTALPRYTAAMFQRRCPFPPAVPRGALGLVFGLCLALAAPAAAQDRFPTAGGDITITPLAHASVQIAFGNRTIQVDPWSGADLSSARPADLILVTDADAGAHHLDRAAIAKLRKPGAQVIMPASGQPQLPDGVVLKNGERRDIALGGGANTRAGTDGASSLSIGIEAIASYDLKPGEPFHQPGQANGYVVTIDGKRLFVAGVTECVPEIRALTRIDVMFVPMNLPNQRMTPGAAAECVRAVKPAVVYPYHYDQGYIRRRNNPAEAASPPDVLQTVDEFVRRLQPDGIEARRGAWYPAR